MLDRMTVKDEQGRVFLKRGMSQYNIFDAIRRLSKYEDSGLEPEEIINKNCKGEWVERVVEGSSPLFRRRFYCSECGNWQTYGKTDFCPSCGKPMVVTVK